MNKQSGKGTKDVSKKKVNEGLERKNIKIWERRKWTGKTMTEGKNRGRRRKTKSKD